ncbi:hypothetical protein [Nocardioides sp. cx-173]|uniref:hypothetical protein n=1 Tax=Nocardioides sp. cx-173 TaxID=2898796 RepID=UPI001E5DD683|nr:hypothetical protein [Nocardioides sp. cx-173]MCD4524202.1 hypothetical protein [Nocardioides sp. cx-173]UGB41594.1 hypothetical protein LQ940_19845 [Nocardioides sp. cx-173]
MSAADLGIALPPSWRQRADPDHGVLVTARASSLPASGVRPELTLACVPVDRPLEEWRAEAMRDLEARLEDFDLEDDDEFDLFGHAVAYRRFAHRLGTADLLCDQWAWRVGSVGVTLTCSVAREDYWDYCDVFEAIAETVDVSPLAA